MQAGMLHTVDSSIHVFCPVPHGMAADGARAGGGGGEERKRNGKVDSKGRSLDLDPVSVVLVKRKQ